MTLDQTATLMDLLIAEWPHLFAGKDPTAMDAKLRLWAGLFADDDPALVLAAAKALLVSSDKPPSIASIKAKMYQLTRPDELTEAEAWALVHQAIRNSAYDSRREFEALPPTLQRLVGCPSQLRDWSQMDADTVQSVVASNLQRSYRARAKTDKDYALLPPDIKALSTSLVAQFSLEGGHP